MGNILLLGSDKRKDPALFLHRARNMKSYLANRWIRTGLVIAGIGWTPLLAICALANAGLWHDPNPNPVGPGLLYFFTFWPAIICVIVGIVKVRRSARARTA